MKTISINLPSSKDDLKALTVPAKQALLNMVPKPKRKLTPEQIAFERIRMGEWIKANPTASFEDYLAYRRQFEE